MRHSITLYGFGYHYMRGEYTLEDVLKKTKKLGAQGFEIVAPQMVEGHPNPSEYWMESFKELYRYATVSILTAASIRAVS